MEKSTYEKFKRFLSFCVGAAEGVIVTADPNTAGVELLDVGFGEVAGPEVVALPRLFGAEEDFWMSCNPKAGLKDGLNVFMDPKVDSAGVASVTFAEPKIFVVVVEMFELVGPGVSELSGSLLRLSDPVPFGIVVNALGLVGIEGFAEAARADATPAFGFCLMSAMLAQPVISRGLGRHRMLMNEKCNIQRRGSCDAYVGKD